jgi:hypothetical protein
MKKPPAKKNPSPGRRDSHRIMDFNFHSLIASIASQVLDDGSVRRVVQDL